MITARRGRRPACSSTPELAMAALASFIRDAVANAEAEGVVVGLSGGVDSALAAALAVRASAPSACTPSSSPTGRRIRDSARRRRGGRARSSALQLRTIDITPQIDAYFAREEPDADPVRRGNKMARERMTILFDQAKKLRLPGARHLEQDRDPARLLDRVRRQRLARSIPTATSTSGRSGSSRAHLGVPGGWSTRRPRPTSGPARPPRASSASTTRSPTRCST